MSLGLLWTDRCFFLVLFAIFLVVINGLRHAPTRDAFSQIFSKPIPVSSAVVLLFFLSIGVVDSIHFKPNSRSLLDNILAPIGDVYEKTYSAPLALNLYTSELAMQDGRVQMVYPRLKYVSSTLKTSAQIESRLKQIVMHAFGVGLSVAFAVWGMILFGKGVLKRRWSFRSSQSAFFGLLTLFFCVVLASFMFELSRDLHVLGTGKIGQDIFYSTVKSIRTGLMIGILTTLFMMPLALLLGISAGYFGGVIDDAIQYIYTTLSSIPGVLLITASVLSMQTYITNHPEEFTTLEENADARLLALCFILGVTSWTSLCRLLRAEALKLKEIDYVLAAKALGSSSFKILLKHLLPNVMHIVIITFVLDFSFLVLAEAVLSYVGVGVSPLTISWGNMINAARLELARDPVVWWPMTAAFAFMFTLVLASNLFAEAVEDAFNPRHHQ
jgi:peptide/nickel transport system permease protein